MKVYIRIDDKNRVTDIDSEAFISDLSNWIEIDNGEGDKYRLAQTNYLTKLIITDEGLYRYKFINGKIMERSVEEINAEMNQKYIQIKVRMLSQECEATIYKGIDVVWGDKASHYSLTPNDQTNIIALTPTAQSGLSVPYHADGEVCREYSPDEFLHMSATTTKYVIYHTTYFNMLKHMIEEMSSFDDIKAIKYGDPLNEKYQILFDNIMQMEG